MSSYNARDPMLPIGSDKCLCTSCGLYFNSTYAFDNHRTGSYGNGRRCRTADELRARGCSLNATGHWITSSRDARAEK